MRRRAFIVVLGGAAAWPVVARAQQTGRLPRVGLLLPFDDERDPQVQDLLPAFKQRMRDLGWIEDRNIRLDIRFTGSTVERIRAGAGDLVETAPDVIFVWSNPAVQVLRQTTQTIPIVFALVSDPIGSGFVTNLARPTDNLTGFQNFEPEMGGKWLEFLKAIAPDVRRVAFFYNQSISANVRLLHSAEAASTSLGEDVVAVPQRGVADIEPTLAVLAQGPNSGLIVAPTPFSSANRQQIIALAARLRLPAIYPFRLDPLKGGLMSYGFDTIEQQRGAAGYVDRILHGAKPQDLPVQLPSKYQLVINLKTAKALGLEVSVQLQQRADEVIE
jgi:putative tryptophan/tyrosine transport system substrate-binding protein